MSPRKNIALCSPPDWYWVPPFLKPVRGMMALFPKVQICQFFKPAFDKPLVEYLPVNYILNLATTSSGIQSKTIPDYVYFRETVKEVESSEDEEEKLEQQIAEIKDEERRELKQ